MRTNSFLSAESPRDLQCRMRPSGAWIWSMVRTYLMEKYEKANPYVGVVHRLDQPVQGLVVFAKTPSAAAELSAQVQDGRMKKEYLAVVCGRLPQTEGTLIHYLKKNRQGIVRVRFPKRHRARSGRS